MPGSGKSTIGKKISRLLNWRFIDLDEEIKQKTGLSPSDWIIKNGESRFREIESYTLKNLDIDKNTVVACGGGTPCFHDNLKWMKDRGICLFINLPISALAIRLTQKNEIGKRPLLQGNETLEERLEQIWKDRKSCFESIDWWINGHHPDLSVIINQIRKK